jgi:hypothetical protein
LAQSKDGETGPVGGGTAAGAAGSTATVSAATGSAGVSGLLQAANSNATAMSDDAVFMMVSPRNDDYRQFTPPKRSLKAG